MPFLLLLLVGGAAVAAVAMSKSSGASGAKDEKAPSGGSGDPERDYLRAIEESDKLYDKYRGGDIVKLQKLADEYEKNAAAATDVARKQFMKYWSTVRDTALTVLGSIAAASGGALAAGAIAAGSTLAVAWPLAIMGLFTAASFGAFVALWSWVFNVGKGYSQEWVDTAKDRIATSMGFGVIPPAFREEFHHSPMGYAKELTRGLNLVTYLDKYYMPGSKSEFINTMYSVLYWSAEDPIIRNNLGRDAASGASVLDIYTIDGSTHDAVNRLTEEIGLAAAHDKKAPIYLYKKMIQGARDEYARMMREPSVGLLKRSERYAGMDYEDGDANVTVEPNAVAIIEAYKGAVKVLATEQPTPGLLLTAPSFESRPLPKEPGPIKLDVMFKPEAFRPIISR
jgi:hypothetical protein